MRLGLTSAVYQYLYYLDQLVLKTDPLSEIRPIAPRAPPGLAQERKSAYDTVDEYRRIRGLPAKTR